MSTFNKYNNNNQTKPYLPRKAMNTYGHTHTHTNMEGTYV